jgi:hypothetical protein
MAGFRMLDGETLPGLLENYAQVAHRTEELVAQFRPRRRPSVAPGALVRARAETAQHAGHADIIRESLDRAKSTG